MYNIISLDEHSTDWFGWLLIRNNDINIVHQIILTQRVPKAANINQISIAHRKNRNLLHVKKKGYLQTYSYEKSDDTNIVNILITIIFSWTFIRPSPRKRSEKCRKLETCFQTHTQKKKGSSFNIINFSSTICWSKIYPCEVNSSLWI